MNLHVLMVSNDGYTAHMGTSIFSLLENNKSSFEKIYVHIIDIGISEMNRKKLIKQVREYKNADISFADLSESFKKVHPIVDHGWDKSIYGRFFVDEVVDESVDKVLYMDGDTVVTASLKGLMSIDITEYILAGVLDIMHKERKAFLGMSDSDQYVNSGVLLLNMKKWREMNIQKKLIEFMNTYPKKLLTPDQDAINAVCGNEILRISPKYNFGWMLTERRLKWDYKKGKFPYSYEELLDVVKDSYAEVVIFHFFGKAKPWRRGECTSEFEQIYLRYNERSPWEIKIGFKSRKKMLGYYIIEKPIYTAFKLMRRFLGTERYDRICEFLENLRKS